MTEELKRITCDPICGFMVQSHDESEVVKLAYEHATGKHPDKHVTTDQLKSMVKPA